MASLGIGMSLLLSCAGTPPAPVIDSQAAPNPDQSFANGDYAEAARICSSKHWLASDADAGALRVRAADAWLLAEQPENAKDIYAGLRSRNWPSRTGQE